MNPFNIISSIISPLPNHTEKFSYVSTAINALTSLSASMIITNTNTNTNTTTTTASTAVGTTVATSGVSNTLKSKDHILCDRFIPSRACSNLDGSFIAEDMYDMKSKITSHIGNNGGNGNGNGSGGSNGSGSGNGSNNNNTKSDHTLQAYSSLLQTQILGQAPNTESMSFMKTWTLPASQYIPKKLFQYKNPKKNMENGISSCSLYPSSLINSSNETSVDGNISKKISKTPFRVLDAPNLRDDFYLNLLDWSSGNIIAVGLENRVYIWSACNSKATRLCAISDLESITAVSWSQHENHHLAVGTTFGSVLIYDTIKFKQLREFRGHQGRVGSISWNGYNICSGSRDRSILIRDIRCPEDYYSRFIGHKQEICGLKWSFDGNLLASGGNDNKLFIWSLKNQGELQRFAHHKAAIKAIGWSPHQYNILASGGGTADRCIRFWNIHTLEMISCIDTGSQVCGLVFSKYFNELVTTHGYSLNQINVWEYPNMQNLATLSGHTYRVLYLAMSPCGQNIVTGAGDETIRFWNVFPGKSKNQGGYFGKSSLYPSDVDLR